MGATSRQSLHTTDYQVAAAISRTTNTPKITVIFPLNFFITGSSYSEIYLSRDLFLS